MGIDIEQRLKDYYAAWSRQNADEVMGFFSDASVFEDLAFAVRFEGLEQIRGFVDLTYAGAPDFRVAPTQIIVNGASAGVAWTMNGTHAGDYPGLPATNKPFEVRATSIVNFEDDTIGTIVDYWSPVEFQRSVGLV